MRKMGEGIINGIGNDYEKNEVIGLTQADNFTLIIKKWLITREELIIILRNLHKQEKDELGELV